MNSVQENLMEIRQNYKDIQIQVAFQVLLKDITWMAILEKKHLWLILTSKYIAGWI